MMTSKDSDRTHRESLFGKYLRCWMALNSLSTSLYTLEFSTKVGQSGLDLTRIELDIICRCYLIGLTFTQVYNAR